MSEKEIKFLKDAVIELTIKVQEQKQEIEKITEEAKRNWDWFAKEQEKVKELEKNN